MAGADAADVPRRAARAGAASARKARPTDEAAAVEQLGLKPRLVAGSRENLKVTWPEDLAIAEGDPEEDGNMRIGQGFDVHRAGREGRKLVIGGVEIPYHKGLDGHSDADVLLHAICDALLGAAGLGDIGRHYPDSDAAYADVDSRALLRDVAQKLQAREAQGGQRRRHHHRAGAAHGAAHARA